MRMGLARSAALVTAVVLGACGGAKSVERPAVVTTVTVGLADSTIPAATTTTATATVLDQNGAPLTGRGITWSSTAPAVATVSGSGTVTGVIAGQAEIVATVESTTGRASLLVTPASVATVGVSGAVTTLLPGQSEQLSATLKDAAGTLLTGRTVTWTSTDTQAVRVSAAGLASGVLPGSAGITATSEGKSGTLALAVHAPVLPQQSGGLTGYLSALINDNTPDDAHGYGFSYYTSVYTLSPEQTAGTQLGWGWWIIPDNTTFGSALCPVGTYARDQLPDRGPTWSSVFQTIEGGMGEWSATRFPSSTPKYRINATPDCYDTQIASTGWTFGGDLLAADELGLAQLSNRVLTPPDGFSFVNGSTPSVLGQAWLALPLIPADTSSAGIATGDQSWTLFLNAANFTGPVAFFTPAIWSAISGVNPVGAGRGQDAQPSFTGSTALEIGTTPMFTSADSGGVRYRRIPRLTFPDDGTGQAALVEDLRAYSKAAIWDAVLDWVQHGTVASEIDAGATAAATLSDGQLGVTLGDSAVTPDSSFQGGVVTTGGGGQALGMRWAGAMEHGVFPEYYEQTGATWTPVAASQVPRTTWLQDQQFTAPQRGSYPAVDQSGGSPWTSTRWSAGPFTATLGDGSVVEYVWYRFIDQPAIARLGLPDSVAQQVQTFVESLHQHSGLAGLAIPAPSSGRLATLDPGLFVVPPTGLEYGYVPIVIGQY